MKTKIVLKLVKLLIVMNRMYDIIYLFIAV